MRKSLLPLFSLMILSFTSTAYATLPKGLTTGQEFIQDVISACQTMRETKNPNAPLPEKFKSYLLQSLERGKKALTQKSPQDKQDQIREILQILEKDTHQLMEGNHLTLYQWNLFHFRLAHFFDIYTDPLHQDRGNDQAILKVVRSQEETAKYLEAGPYGFDAGYSALDQVLNAANYRMSPDLQICPIAKMGDLGIVSINQAFAENVYPFGVASGHLNWDGIFHGGSVDFISHDAYGHNATDVRNFMKQAIGIEDLWKRKQIGYELPLLEGKELERLQTEGPRIRKHHSNFLKWIESLPVEDQQKIHIEYFAARHEPPETLDITQWCAQGENTNYNIRMGMPSDMNYNLPVELHGDRSWLKELDAEYYRSEKFRGEPRNRITGPLYEKISAYAKSARKTFCEYWAQYELQESMKNVSLSSKNTHSDQVIINNRNDKGSVPNENMGSMMNHAGTSTSSSAKQ